VTSIFTGKKTAFLLSGPWQIPDVEKSGVPYEITPIPGFQGGKEARPFVGVQAMYVASQGRFKSLAQEFATNYFIQPEFVAGFIGSPPMNMAVGKVVRPDGNGDLAVRLGSVTLRLHPSVEKDRPALAAYVARDVAIGIRSEDMEDARLVRDAPADSRLKATVSLVEALGAQVVVHFDVDAPKVVTADTKLLDKDAHTEDVPAHMVEGTKFVAAFAPRSRVRAGDQVEVVVDTERMHFFDPETGNAIRD
jgi:ABC-type sugar transport system ATPase subunit